MIRRLESLIRPESDEHLASPDPGEAFGVWMLGTLCVLLVLWLGDLGTHSLIPGVVVCGVPVLLGWRRLEWLFWLPGVAVVATLAQPLVPARPRLGSLDYVDVLMMGVVAVALVRGFALRRRVAPRTPVDPLVWALLVLGALALIPPARRAENLLALKHLVIALLVYYSTVAVASRAGGARWIWPAFPLALAVLGLHAAWTFTLGPERLRAHARAADLVWGSREGLLVTLLTALPVSLGLATDAGHRAARRVWQGAVVLGAAGIAAHVSAAGPFDLRAGLGRPQALPWAMLAVGWVLFAALARMAWWLAETRPSESPRWAAVALTCLALPLLPLMGLPASGTTAMLLTAIGGGLVAGTRRALERDVRHAVPGRDDAASELVEAA